MRKGLPALRLPACNWAHQRPRQWQGQLLANAAIAASRVAPQPGVGVASSWCSNISVHIQGEPTGDAAELKMRPTTLPPVSTSKSSSFHLPDGREAEARLRMR